MADANDNPNASAPASTVAAACQAVNVELLANLLYTWRKPLWLAMTTATDGWDLILRPGLEALKAEWLAVVDERGQVWIVSDGAVFKDCPKIARPLPTAGPAFVRKMGRCYGAAAFTVSAGWTEGVRRMARLLEDCPATTRRRHGEGKA